MEKDDKPFKTIEELAIKTPSDSDIGIIERVFGEWIQGNINTCYGTGSA